MEGLFQSTISCWEGRPEMVKDLVKDLELSATKQCKSSSWRGEERYPEVGCGGGSETTCCINAPHSLAPWVEAPAPSSQMPLAVWQTLTLTTPEKNPCHPECIIRGRSGERKKRRKEECLLSHSTALPVWKSWSCRGPSLDVPGPMMHLPTTWDSPDHNSCPKFTWQPESSDLETAEKDPTQTCTGILTIWVSLPLRPGWDTNPVRSQEVTNFRGTDPTVHTWSFQDQTKQVSRPSGYPRSRRPYLQGTARALFLLCSPSFLSSPKTPLQPLLHRFKLQTGETVPLEEPQGPDSSAWNSMKYKAFSWWHWPLLTAEPG